MAIVNSATHPNTGLGQMPIGAVTNGPAKAEYPYDSPQTKTADEIAHEAMIDTGDLTALEHALEMALKNDRVRRLLVSSTSQLDSLDSEIITKLFGRIKVAKIRTELRVKESK